MRYIIALFFGVLLIHPAMSQENDSVARASFAAAQSAYANGDYKIALNQIRQVEIAQEGATPKSLYLKIKALNELSNIDQTYLPALQSSLNTFFSLTDRNAYPLSKYQEIADIRSAKGNLATNENSAKRENTTYSKEEEQKDYDAAIKSNTMEVYKAFLDKYTFTPHYADIKKRYDDMVDAQNYAYEHDKAVKKRMRKEERYRYMEDRYMNF